MSQPNQCPSTKGKRSPSASRREPGRENGRVTGRKYWRSLEEYSDTPEFREFLEREFPAGASELAGNSRRDFIKLMGASLALAGAATIPGCRRPDYKIMAYSGQSPEEIIPGKPLYYATSMPLPCGGAEGLLIETHEGRPTKVEGNPLHPVNRGKCSSWALSSVLGMYDPDRLKEPLFHDGNRVRRATWDDFDKWLELDGFYERYDENDGEGLVIIADKKWSPTRNAQRDRVLERWPKARWVPYDPVESVEAYRGTAKLFGEPHREHLHFDKARVIFTIDRDFTHQEAGSLVHAREFARTRRVMEPDDEMSRLYAAETAFTNTGSLADHRLGLAPSRMTGLVVEVGRRVLAMVEGTAARPLAEALGRLEVPAGDDLPADWIRALAEDLVDNRGRSLIVCGASQPAEVHAVVHALNLALGNAGETVTYTPVPEDSDETVLSVPGLEQVAGMIEDGDCDAIICLGVNPVYDAPGGMDFAEKFSRVPRRITLSVGASETAAASTWQLNAAHYLEAWGDTEACDGTISPVQPMIAPLYGNAFSDIEFLAKLAGDRRPKGYELVRAHWRDRFGEDGFDRRWRRSLHNGLVEGTGDSGGVPSRGGRVFQRAAEAAESLRMSEAPTENSLDVSVMVGHLYDGRFANAGWLQELPHPGTLVVWDNPAVISPATAERLGLEPEPYTRKEPEARVAVLSVNGRTMEIPVWIMPGMADNTVLLQPGFGREVCGAVGDGVGFNVASVLPGDGRRTARGASLERTRRGYFIASTQNHWSMESRTSIVRQLDVDAFRRHAGTIKEEPDKIYGTHPTRLNIAERLGEMDHTPASISIYDNPYNAGPGDPDPDKRVIDGLGRERPPVFARRPQWGMTIDLSTCTGCGACTVACQSENNIPVVGKSEVGKGRIMTWIRVDRYFVGEDWRKPDEMLHQPVACVQCDNAPCETVCPVNATVQGPEGLNEMAYNRCIGTRYCSNNCPYKVRRFNFFDYATKKFNGSFIGERTIGARPDNVNLIPPRLREQIDEISKMKMNPDVTVRSRGVMEKCTYCVQRINRARFEMKLKDLDNIPDGFFQVACQQACPSESIVFGDILNPEGEVAKTREHDRSYLLLGYLNTRPRTSHMLRVRNPNPAIREPEDPLASARTGEGGALASFGVDPSRVTEDPGYAMSLRVLGAPVGGQA